MIDKDVYERRGYHPAECRDNRKHSLFYAGELSMGDFPPYFQPHGEEKYHHKDIVDEFLYGEISGKKDVYSGIRAGQVDLQVGLKDCVVQMPGKRQVCQQHGKHYAGHEQNSLKPWLLGKLVAALVKLNHTFVPSVHGNQFCHFFASFSSLNCSSSFSNCRLVSRVKLPC